MFFTVCSSKFNIPSRARSKAFLLVDNWDDFGFKTLYELVIFDSGGECHEIGYVKIGQFGMQVNQRSPGIPNQFDELHEQFFSLGQDDSYYVDLNKLDSKLRDKVFRGLRDMALDLGLFDRALHEDVTGTSLLRFITHESVRGQFNRIALGGARLSRYEFKYIAPNVARSHVPPSGLDFAVIPESYPPTNIHVLIGRNGVGKTTILDNMAHAIIETDVDVSQFGKFSSEATNTSAEHTFTNLVSVTFSAFDPFEPLPTRQNKSKGIQYAYIGLKHVGTSKEGRPLPPKSPTKLSKDFGQSILVCRQGARASRWRRALEMLEADPIFHDAGVAALASGSMDVEEEQMKSKARKLFNRLSSGHKIVLLTITRLIETVQEKTLILLDEPEAHLHPPLLSAFVRALSDLLINRNGVAIIATHSPVVLQEIPKSCVWKVRRTGKHVVAERPEIETFGENVGILTREVFGLEVTHSGFHKMLHDAVVEKRDYEAVVEQFGGEMGGEAKAIIRALIVAAKKGLD